MSTAALDLDSIQQLKPLPISVIRLAALSLNEESSLKQVIEVVKFDEALCLDTLRWANSAWSGSQSSIYKIEEAVVRLGLHHLVKLAMSYHLSEYFWAAQPGYILAENQLWSHSVAAALAVEKMADLHLKPVPGGFSAALMHDIGKLILGRRLGHLSMQAALRTAMDDMGKTYIEAEQMVSGTDHAKIGGMILRHWNLPEEISTAVEFHHDPDAASSRIADSVHVANAVAKLIGQGLGSEEMNMQVSTDAAERLGIHAQDIPMLCATVAGELETVKEQWGMC